MFMLLCVHVVVCCSITVANVARSSVPSARLKVSRRPAVLDPCASVHIAMLSLPPSHPFYCCPRRTVLLLLQRHNLLLLVRVLMVVRWRQEGRVPVVLPQWLVITRPAKGLCACVCVCVCARMRVYSYVCTFAHVHGVACDKACSPCHGTYTPPPLPFSLSLSLSLFTSIPTPLSSFLLVKRSCNPGLLTRTLLLPVLFACARDFYTHILFLLYQHCCSAHGNIGPLLVPTCILNFPEYMSYCVLCIGTICCAAASTDKYGSTAAATLYCY